MPLSPQSEKELNGSRYAPHPVAVREQLQRLLSHPLFTHSKRYPVLLAYTVEQTLLGHASELKERTIGIEAFGRDPSYDVNLDPVVRTTAAEVRKRLIQYYYNPDHAGELIVEMPLGSYIPVFREPAVPAHEAAAEPAIANAAAASSAHSTVLPGAHASLREPAARTRRRLWVAIAVAMALLAGFVLGRIGLPRQPSNLERFWEPITSASSRVTYCLGMPGRRRESSQSSAGQSLPGPAGPWRAGCFGRDHAGPVNPASGAAA